MNKKGKVLILGALAILLGLSIYVFTKPKEKLKVNLHEVKYIERDYKTGE